MRVWSCTRSRSAGATADMQLKQVYVPHLFVLQLCILVCSLGTMMSFKEVLAVRQGTSQHWWCLMFGRSQVEEQVHERESCHANTVFMEWCLFLLWYRDMWESITFYLWLCASYLLSGVLYIIQLFSACSSLTLKIKLLLSFFCPLWFLKYFLLK